MRFRRLLRQGAIASAIGAAALAATPAAAQDGNGPGYYGEPYPSFWQGAYAGVHVGVSDGDGVVGGGQIGYNWQSGRIVYGVEADIAASSISDSVSFCSPLEPGLCSHARSSLDWLATVRGRVGYLFNPNILAYATAGVAIASWSADIGVSLPDGSGIGTRFDGTDTDFVIGLGIEGRISEAMSARIEFLSSDNFDGEIFRAGLNFKLGR